MLKIYGMGYEFFKKKMEVSKYGNFIKQYIQ